MKKLSRIFFMTSILTAPTSSWGDPANDTASIEERLDHLEKEVSELKKELQQQKAQNSKSSPRTSADRSQESVMGYENAVDQGEPAALTAADSHNVFTMKFQDGNYKLEIGGYAQVEAREFAAHNKEELAETSSFLPRRVRLRIDGTVAHDFDFFIQPDFGYNNAFSTITSTTPGSYSPSLMDAWMDYSRFPQAVIKVGKMKTPFDLENLQDTRFTAFTELGLTGNLSPQRDVGAQMAGTWWYDRITYAVGIFNGAADRENAYGGYSTTSGGDTNSRSGTCRIFVEPFKETNLAPLSGLGVGYAASYGKQKGSDLPSYVTGGQAPVFTYNSNVSADGPQLRAEPQAYYYYKSLGILSEKVDSRQRLEYATGGQVVHDTPDNKAFEITGTYVLTGENASYNGVVPRYNFNPSAGHWGAFELAGRYGELRLDSSIFSENFANSNTSVSEARAWATGINWYLNRNVKLVFDYEQTKFRRGAANGKATDDRKTENLLTGLAQLSF